MVATTNPMMAIGLVFVALIALLVLVMIGLCVLALFLPVILVVAGLFILLMGRGLSMNVRIFVGFGLILIGALWLIISW